MKRLFVIYICLILLTLVSAYISYFKQVSAWIPIAVVMALVCIKFILVVLEYMEMRKSNNAWKFGVIFPALLAALVIGIFTISI